MIAHVDRPVVQRAIHYIDGCRSNSQRPRRSARPASPAAIRSSIPEIDQAQAARLAAVARALSDPIRVQLVDVLRRHAGKVCVCELTPLFDVSQPTVSHHLKVLRDAGLVDVERRGLWAFYYVIPEATKELQDMAEMKPHLALTVSDVDRAVPFYRALFDAEPAKVKPGLREVRARRPRHRA